MLHELTTLQTHSKGNLILVAVSLLCLEDPAKQKPHFPEVFLLVIGGRDYIYIYKLII